MTFWMETLRALKKKGLNICWKKPQIYEVIPIELFVDMKNVHEIVEVAHTTMLENLVSKVFIFK